MLLIVGVIATGWGATTMAVPAANAQEETLVFWPDIAFPPMEFLEGSEAVGADIDIGNEVAKRMDAPQSSPMSASMASSRRFSPTSATRSSPA